MVGCLLLTLPLSPCFAMVVVAKGDHVWYDDGSTGEFDLPIGAIVKHADAGQIIIILDGGEEKWIPTAEHSKLKIMHITSATGVEDMVSVLPLRYVSYTTPDQTR